MNFSLTKMKPFFLLLSIFMLASIAAPLYAGGDDGGGISWKFLIIELFGGLSLFLYGMGKMSEGMKKTAGNKMRSILAALTSNRVIALVVGAFITMVIQSSSATTVMLVSFVQAGLMNFAQTIGVILGSHIGTTVTAQLIAFKLTDYALIMIAVGVGMQLFTKEDRIRSIGSIILGFGILFYGMKLMSSAMTPLRTYPPFIDFMKGLETPLTGILFGAVFTALLQSSSASTGIVIVLAQQGLITLEAGIPVILGANIGTCVTAGLASIGTSRAAKRVALAHVLFQVIGVFVFITWIPGFAHIIREIAAIFDSGTARQIANVHTFFNVSMALAFLPFTTIFARFLNRILPEKEVDKAREMITWHLEDSMISTPVLAINLAKTEISRVAKLIERMLRGIIIPFMSDEKLISRERVSKDDKEWLIKEIPKRDAIFPELSLLEGIDMREDKIDFLEEKIGEYLIKIARQDLSSKQANEAFCLMAIINDLEKIGDIIHRNMLPLVEKKRALEKDFSDEGKEELMIYHDKACRQIHLLREAFAEANPQTAMEIMSGEKTYLDLETQYRLQHLERILHGRKESIKTHEVHMELLDLFKQIIVYSSNIAKTFFETAVKTQYEHPVDK